jgi:hypothetical protein
MNEGISPLLIANTFLFDDSRMQRKYIITSEQ